MRGWTPAAGGEMQSFGARQPNTRLQGRNKRRLSVAAPAPDFVDEYASPTLALVGIVLHSIAFRRILFRTDLFRQSAVHYGCNSSGRGGRGQIPSGAAAVVGETVSQCF